MAFATSPHGLGLELEQFWDITPREFSALRDVHDQALYRWALDRAMFANANFRERNDRGECVDAPFEPEDFLGRGNREKRTAEKKRDRMAAMMANAALAKIKPGDEVEGLPSWAIGEYHAS